MCDLATATFDKLEAPPLLLLLQSLGAAESLHAGEPTKVSHDQLAATNEESVAERIMKKFADGEIRMALRLLTTTDSVAALNQEVADIFKAKHSPTMQNEELPHPLDAGQHHLLVSGETVFDIIHDFPPGSAAGLDSVGHMHIRQLPAKNHRRIQAQAPWGSYQATQCRHFRQHQLVPLCHLEERRRCAPHRRRYNLPPPSLQASVQENGIGHVTTAALYSVRSGYKASM